MPTAKKASKKKRKSPTRKPPRFTNPNDIPPGTGIFIEEVRKMRPGARVTLWRDVKRGNFPPPSGYAGNRPYWNVDIVRAATNGQWHPETAAAPAAPSKWRAA